MIVVDHKKGGTNQIRQRAEPAPFHPSPKSKVTSKNNKQVPFVQFEFNLPTDQHNSLTFNPKNNNKGIKKGGKHLLYKTLSHISLSAKHPNNKTQPCIQPLLLTEIKQRQKRKNSIGKKGNFLQKKAQRVQQKKAVTMQKDSEYSVMQQECEVKPVTSEDIFKEVNKRMILQSQMNNRKDDKKDCFYYNLKNNLIKRLECSEQGPLRQQIMLMIAGCEKQKHTINSATKFKLNNKHRQKSVQNIHSYMPYEATKSRRGSTKMLSQQNVFFDKSSKRRAHCYTSRSKLQQSRPQSSRNTVNKHSKTYHSLNTSFHHTTKRTSHNKNIEGSGKAIQDILNQCKLQKTDPNNINKQMKIFQFYCRRIDHEFQKAAFVLEEIKDDIFQ